MSIVENTVLADEVRDGIFRREIRRNLDMLTTVSTDGVLPLLTQLEQAKYPSGEVGGGGRGSVTSAPASLAVLDVCEDIETSMREIGVTPEPNLTAGAMLIYDWLPSLEDRRLSELVEVTGRWVCEITELLYPVRRTPLVGISCTECGHCLITRYADDGYEYHDAALKAIWMDNRVNGVECGSCGTAWGRHQILDLVSPDALARIIQTDR